MANMISRRNKENYIKNGQIMEVILFYVHLLMSPFL